MFEKGNRGNTIHGILLIALFSFAAFYIAEIPFVKSLSFSPLIVGIILGMLYANSLRNHLPETWVPGIKFCTKQILRAGIVLYGFRLTLTEVAAVGLPAVIIDTIIVAGTIFLGIWLGRAMKMDKDTSLMTATGSAICGAAAVLGAEPVVKCEGHKTAIAVSTVVIFGTISMFLYPIMYRAGMLDGLGDMGVAIYTGSTLHEVAHVAGAGNAMDPTDALGIAGTATITKMIRVMMLVPVLLITTYLVARARKRQVQKGQKFQKIAVPWFAIGFMGVIAFNSFDLLPAHLAVRSPPGDTAVGMDSPVIAEASICETPFTTWPSMGIISPGSTCTMSPFTISFGSFSTILSPTTSRAVIGFCASSAFIERRELEEARS